MAVNGEKQFSQAVLNAKKQSSAFKAELKSLSAEFEGNANSMEFLKQKHVIPEDQKGRLRCAGKKQGGFYKVQYGVFEGKKNEERLVKKMKKAGFDAIIK